MNIVLAVRPVCIKQYQSILSGLCCHITPRIDITQKTDRALFACSNDIPFCGYILSHFNQARSSVCQNVIACIHVAFKINITLCARNLYVIPCVYSFFNRNTANCRSRICQNVIFCSYIAAQVYITNRTGNCSKYIFSGVDSAGNHNIAVFRFQPGIRTGVNGAEYFYVSITFFRIVVLCF